jgi:hypothetical protein|uniref:Uncharacterized protein n=1 Tax=candidate division WOR-3 bacterium TaxID=2052148 RepID=A0A7V5XZP4_UNCW3
MPFNLFSFFARPEIKITVNKIYYFSPRINAKHSIIIDLPSYPPCYQALVGVYNGGKKKFILKDVVLNIENFTLPCANHQILEIQPDEYKQFLWIFPAPLFLTKQKGKFILTLIDNKNRKFSITGRFPKFDLSY